LRKVFCPVLEFREEKRTFAKVERGNVYFFFSKWKRKTLAVSRNRSGIGHLGRAAVERIVNL
jgi:hypothetical protein